MRRFSRKFGGHVLVAICFSLFTGACGDESENAVRTPDGLQVLSSNEWVFEQPTLWNQEEGVLELTSPGTPFDGIRRPFSVAYLAGTEELSDFHLTAQVKSTQDPEVVGRDVIIVFGYQSPSQFYYAHLSNDNRAAVHNAIFVVNHADRRRIDDQSTENPPETRLMDTAWHQIRVDRDAQTGSIKVYLDDLRDPLITATDDTFSAGAVGFGSFDDTGAIRNIRLESGTGPLIDPIPETVEVGELTLALEEFVVIPPSGSSTGAKARINYLDHAGDDSGRLFVNDLRGRMYVINGSEVSVYLDLAAQFPDFFDENGLGSGFGFFAFHPEFDTNGTFYTVHTEAGDALKTKTPDYSHQSVDVVHGVLVEWVAAEPAASIFSGSHREILRLGFPSALHGIQQIGFRGHATPTDEDYALLYVSVGDGERPGFQTANPQSLSAHTGKMYRLDPLGGNSPNGRYGIPASNPFVAEDDALGEIWALGLRNPHRFSWDPDTDSMYISHIGEQNVDSIFPGKMGANYGWNLREGGFRYEKENPLAIYPLIGDDTNSGFTSPLLRLDHDELRAIVGGLVYRGDRLPALYGKYLFADIVSGTIFYSDAEEMARSEQAASIRKVVLQDAGGTKRSFDHFAESLRTDLRFGMDAQGEIYVLYKSNGSIWRIVSASINSPH